MIVVFIIIVSAIVVGTLSLALVREVRNNIDKDCVDKNYPINDFYENSKQDDTF